MKDQAIFAQAVKHSEQLESLAATHRMAIKLLIDLQGANRRLAHALDNNNEGKANGIRAEIAKLQDEYFGIIMTLLFNETV